MLNEVKSGLDGDSHEKAQETQKGESQGGWRYILDEIEFIPGPSENIYVWG